MATMVAIRDLMSGPIETARRLLDPARVEHYMAHLDESPPVVVYDTADGLLLADGYHRVAAAERLGRRAVAADVRKGERADALRFVVANAREQRGASDSDVLRAIERRGAAAEGEAGE